MNAYKGNVCVPVRTLHEETGQFRPAFSCPPYELRRDEFNHYRELHRPDGNGQQVLTRGAFNKLKQHLTVMAWLSFDVHGWLFRKACNGDEEALFKLNHCYDLYEEVITKAMEEVPGYSGPSDYQ
jgi:hypothetical protein